MGETAANLYDRIDRILRLVAELNPLETNDLMVCRQSDKPVTFLSPTVKAHVLRTPVRQRSATRISMRKREREKVLGKLSHGSEIKHGQSVHVRPYHSDGEKLDEIARETGEVKAAIVRRMIRFALSEKQQSFVANPCRDKLDWLIKNGRNESGLPVGLDARLDEVLDRIESIEKRLETVDDISRKVPSFLREIYCMSGISLSSQNLIFTRLLEFASPKAEEREQSGIIAARALANQIAQAVKDLNQFSAFLNTPAGSDHDGDDLFLLTKIKAIRDLISAQPPGRL